MKPLIYRGTVALQGYKRLKQKRGGKSCAECSVHRGGGGEKRKKHGDAVIVAVRREKPGEQRIKIVALYAPPKNKIQNPRGWRERKERRASDTVPGKREKKRSRYASSERGDASKSGHREQQRGTERSEERRRDRRIHWKAKNKSVLQPPNYFNLHRIMNAAIKNNKKPVHPSRLTFPGRNVQRECKHGWTKADARQPAREERGKETGEKGGTKRGKNRGDIESAWVLRDRVNESTGQLHGVDCKARSKYSGVLVIRLPFSRSCVLLYEVLWILS